MVRAFWGVLALATILVAGCKKGYDSNQLAALTDSERKVVGRWTLERMYPDGESAELKKLMEIIDEGSGGIAMECLPDKTFTLTAFNIPVKGTWSVSATTVTLRIEKVGDMRPEEVGQIASKNNGVSGWDMDPARRTEFLHSIGNAAALETAEELAQLQIGVDGKSLYSKKSGNDNPFNAGINVFRPAK